MQFFGHFHQIGVWEGVRSLHCLVWLTQNLVFPWYNMLYVYSSIASGPSYVLWFMLILPLAFYDFIFLVKFYWRHSIPYFSTLLCYILSTFNGLPCWLASSLPYYRTCCKMVKLLRSTVPAWSFIASTSIIMGFILVYFYMHLFLCCISGVVHSISTIFHLGHLVDMSGFLYFGLASYIISMVWYIPYLFTSVVWCCYAST